ncbi:MAG: glycosyltransferase [Acidimicrobiales bacterium]
MTSIIDTVWSLRTAMRRLWTDHAIWTRQYIVAAVAGTPDAKAAAARLLRNQEDIGNAIVPYYGEDAGAALTKYLKEHILIAVDLVAAAKDGNNVRFGIYDRKWTRNARSIATFLSRANPYWSRKDVMDLLELHLQLTKGEAVARLEGNWDADVDAFDEILTEMLTLSDALSEGIVHQFAEKFVA